MPIPKPRTNEKEKDFIGRCMGDSVTVKEFPDASRRAAVCHRQWDDRKKNQSALAAGDIVCLANPGAFSTEELDVDLDAGEIRNASVITAGEAVGHGFEIDEVMLEQVRDGINSNARGIRSRFTHPEVGGLFTPPKDEITLLVGAVRNARISGDQVRADIKLYDFANHSPNGPLKDYLLGVAIEAPEKIGLSIKFELDEFEEKRDPKTNVVTRFPRIKEMRATDFVGDPAANPAGLLSAINSGGNPPHNPEGGIDMNPELKAALVALGMAESATDTEAVEFIGQLSKTKTKTLVSQEQIAEAIVALRAAVAEAVKPNDPPAKTEEELKTEREAEIKKAVVEALAAERERSTKIHELAAEHKLSPEWATKIAQGGKTVDQARELIELATNMSPISITVGANLATQGLGQGIVDALMLRQNTPLIELNEHNVVKRTDDGKLALRTPSDRGKAMRHMSIVGLGRAFLQGMGVPDVHGLPPVRVADLCLKRDELARTYGGSIVALVQGTGDFPAIMRDAINKTLRAQYEETPSTWELWARPTTVADFKTIRRVQLGAAPNLIPLAEGMEIIYGVLGEGEETYALVEFARGLRFTHRAMVNDDTDALSRAPRLLGSSAKRTEEIAVYAILTLNANMADGNALFSVAHANVSAAAAIPSVATLNAGKAALRLQTGLAGEILDLIPQGLIHPAALEGTVRELLNSQFVPAATMGHTGNIWQGELQPITAARLDATSATVWYLCANSNEIDTVELARLEGQEAPVLTSETEFDTGDLKLAVKHNAAAKAIDWRGLYRNA